MVPEFRTKWIKYQYIGTIETILFCRKICSENRRRKLTSPVVGVKVPHDDVIAHGTQDFSGRGTKGSEGWAHVPRLNSYQLLDRIVHFSIQEQEREREDSLSC